jgi:N-acetyl-anhydromuramyl-L-alanine amidase AmpD
MANVLEVLQAAGLDVEAEPGWETRRGSKYSFDHRPGGTLGMIVHHTAAGGSADMPCRNICVNGRSDLKGPLVQFLLGRSGKLLLISQNRCNHAGRGSSEVIKDLEASRDITAEFDAGQSAYNARNFGRDNDYRKANGRFWGVEVENNGIGEEYSQEQIKALVKLCAAMCKWQGWDHNRIIHHREWTSRKYDMSYTGPLREYVQKMMASSQWRVPKGAIQTGTKPPVTPSKRPTVFKQGSTGEEVKEIQQALSKLGYRVVINGEFDTATHYGVVRFQRKHRLTVDGIVGPQTLSKIRAQQKRPSVTTEAREYPGTLIKRGSRGPDVRWVQQHIGVKLIDGVFGRGTERAVKNFQRRHRLKADGIIGRKTWAAIHNS